MSSRSDIRAAIATIAESLPSIKSVFIGRRRTIQPHQLPAACVYVEREAKELNSIQSPRSFRRELTVVTEFHIRADSPEAAELALDGLCAERDAALLANESLDGCAFSALPVSDQYEISEEAAAPAAVAICSDSVVYY